ncbi:MAG: hypothetical protein LBB29_02450 [Holosporaceae bacterium]|jgi:hypothetical protein|nr:hypothetical protein [Holosporaceae bacterium]
MKKYFSIILPNVLFFRGLSKYSRIIQELNILPNFVLKHWKRPQAIVGNGLLFLTFMDEA